MGKGPEVGPFGFARRFRKVQVTVMAWPTTACNASFYESKIPSPYSSEQDATWSRALLQLRSHFLTLPLSCQPHFAILQNGKHSSFSGHLHFFSLLPMTPTYQIFSQLTPSFHVSFC